MSCARIVALAVLTGCVGANLLRAADAPERTKDGVALALGARRLEVRACRDDVVRVVSRPRPLLLARVARDRGRRLPADFFEVQTGPVRLRPQRRPGWSCGRAAGAAGAVRFLDRDGRVLLAEKQRRRGKSRPGAVMGESTAHVQAEFEPEAARPSTASARIRTASMDYAGRDSTCFQLNIVDVVPFLVSSRGYGILWDNYVPLAFGDLRSRCTCRRRTCRRQGPPGRPHRQLTARAMRDRQGRRDAHRPADRVGARRRTGRRSRRSTTRRKSRTQRVDPKLRTASRASPGKARSSSRAAGEYDLLTFVEQRRPPLRRRSRSSWQTWRQGWLPWWRSAAPARRGRARERHQAAARVAPRRHRGHDASQVEAAAALALDVALVRGRRRHRLLLRYGPDLDDVVAGYRELTGAPLCRAGRSATSRAASATRRRTSCPTRSPSSARAGSRST